MRILLIHHESAYFGGAEKVLGYFLEGLAATEHEAAVACVENSRVAALVPNGIRKIFIADGDRFSPLKLWRQARTIRAARAVFPFDLVHGWAAREWELTALTGRLSGRPALGMLHDHPNAVFRSFQRRFLMRWSVRLGLENIICVSDAVRRECAAAADPGSKLRVVRNGLPLSSARPDCAPHHEMRLGYLGAFSGGKGLKVLFQVLDELTRRTPLPWCLEIAGGVTDSAGQSHLNELRQTFSQRPWWPNVKWAGWVDRPVDFLRSLDLLVFPSTDFDAFPTVLLEAGAAGVGVLASRIGGVPEIIEDGKTGWLFPPGNVPEAARILANLLQEPNLARQAGEQAALRIRSEFSLDKMVGNYLTLYSQALAPAPSL